VAPGQYERPIVPIAGATAGTATLEGLPDAGRCYFALNAGPQDEWLFDFTALSGGRALPGQVRNLNVTWEPTPPQPILISAVAFGSTANAGSQPLQIPTGTTGLVLMWEGYLTQTMASVFVGARALTMAQNVAATGAPDFLRAAGAAFLANPSGPLSWDFNGTTVPAEGVVFVVAYLRDSSGIAESKLMRRPGANLSDTLTFAPPGLLLGLVCSAQPPAAPAANGTLAINDFTFNGRACDLGAVTGTQVSGQYGYGTVLGVRMQP